MISMLQRSAWWSVALLVVGSWWGCATSWLSSSPPPPSAPFFSATSEDATQLALLASELDSMAMDCAADNACNDQVHFSRALVSLFENREAARASFEQLIELHPSSPFAASSALWLQLLQDEGRSSPSNDLERRLLTDLTTQWVREWMARQLTVRTSQGKIAGFTKSTNVQMLQRQVQERDQRIADLKSQLEALKVIDQEQLDRRKVRPPASLVPRIETPR